MGAATSANVKNVIVIGETGVGKSCVINLILGREDAQVSSSTVGCTFAITKYEFENFCLFDTVGYSDTTEKDPKDALKKLIQLAKDTMEEGIALIVYIMKKGRITSASTVNYNFFVKKFCEDKVPVMLIVTHCEDDSINTHWYSGQQQNFEDLNMIFAGAICGCAMKLPNPDTDPDLVNFYQRKKDKTQEEVRKMMGQLVLDNPWKPANWMSWVTAIFVGALGFGITATALTAFLPEVSLAFGALVVTSIKSVLSTK